MSRSILLGLVALGAALRLPWLASRPLWLDEALQHHVSSAPDLGGVLSRLIAADLHPPGYALLGHLLLRLGDHEAVLRLPAFVAGVAAIVAADCAVRAWTTERSGLVAAGLVAVCPPCVAWSREARPYTLALLALLALLWAAAQARRGRAAPLALAAVGCLPWHYGGWLVLGAVLGALLLDPETRRPALTASIVALLVAAPLLGVLVPQLEGQATPHLTGHTGLRALAGLPWLLGWLVSGSSAPAAVGLGALLLPLLWTRDRALLRLGLLPVAAVLCAALLGAYPLGPVRHGLVLLPGLLLLVAPRLPAAPAVLAGAALTAITLARAPGVPVHDTPTLLAALAAARHGEPVWVDPLLSWPVRRYGLPDGAVIGGWGDPWPAEGWVLTIGDGPGELRAAGVRAVWMGGGDVPRR